MDFIAIITSICLTLIFIGFLIGFLRSWKKSLVRFGILLGSLLIALFISPLIVSKLMSKFVSGNTFSAFGITLNFDEIASNIIKEENIVSDLMAANSTTMKLATSLMHVALNVIGFLLTFLVLALISLLVYWIVVLIIRARRKKEGVQVEKNASYWWLKVLGGGIGTLSMFLICFVILTPVFGVMNVCDKFLEDSNKNAKAVAVTTYVSADLYYTEDDSIGNIEGYIKKYAEIREKYNKSFVGKTFNGLGISKLGTATFNRLTNVTTDGLHLNVTNELVSLISAYNIYKENFIAKEFDIKNNESLDAVLELYEISNESEIVESYMKELIPKLCSRWIEDEAFLGIEMPIKGDYAPLAKHILKVFNSSNTTRLENNVKTLVGVMKVANNNGFIEAVQNNTDIVDYLSSNDTFVEDAILQLSSTNEFRHSMPDILCSFTEIMYDTVVGGDATFEKEVLTNEEIDKLNWNNEANLLQGIVSSTLDVYNATKDSSNSDVMADQLVNVGVIIDNAKESKLIAKPFRVFVNGFVNSGNFKLKDEIKTKVSTAINDHWNDSDYSFETMFGTLQETIKVTQAIASGNGSVDLNDLSGVLNSAIKDKNVKDTLLDTLQSDIVGDIAGEDDSAKVMTEMLETFITNTKEDTLEKDIAAGQEVVDLVNASKNNANNELVLEGITTAEKQAEADEIVKTIANSQVVVDMLVAEDSSVKTMTQGLKGSDVNLLLNSIENNETLTGPEKEALAKLFLAQ